MSTTLNAITLPPLQWTNEFTQERVSQSTQRTLAGNTVVYYGQRKNGYPIDLESKQDTGWVTRSTLKQLQSISQQAGLVMPLEIRGETHQVMFRHNEGQALEATPLWPYSSPVDDDYYLVKLKLITVD